MRRRILGCGLAALIAGLAGVWFWPRPKINLLLITLDTTRADRLGCYGYTGARTPALNSLAASGILCQRAYTVAPLTLPAHASLLTGLYPAETGVRSNGRGRLDDGPPTLAEILKRQGYDTAAFVASFVLDRKFGLERGFKAYDDDISDSNLAEDSLHRERNAAEVVDAALEWLGEARSGPFFCWAHFYDPHAPYLAHEDLFGDEFRERPYDAEIAYVDRQVARLLDFLKSSGLDSHTLIVVVGDHGESLGEHFERTHGMTLYETVLHVPLIIRQGGALHPAPASRFAHPLSLVDLPATILDLMDVSGPRSVGGKSFVSGLRGGAFAGSECYAATDEPFLNNGWSPLRSLTEGSWKYVRTPRAELFDLAHDPAELHNLIDEEPARAAEMEARLVKLEAGLALRPGSAVQLRPSERRALEGLGYLAGGKSAPVSSPREELPDIKDMLPVERLVDAGADQLKAGALDEAIETLEQVVAQSLGHSKGHWLLSVAWRRKGETEKAAEILRSLLSINPVSVEAHYGLAQIMLEQGRDDDALPELQQVLALDPDFGEAHYDLAMIHVRRREPDEAVAEFNAALEIDRHHGAAYRERATLLVTQGRAAEALADYRKALSCNPDDAVAHHNLGLVLASQGEGDEALAHLKRAAELDPRNAEFHYAQGTLLLEHGKDADAVRHLQQALELDPANERIREQLNAARKKARSSSN